MYGIYQTFILKKDLKKTLYMVAVGNGFVSMTW